MKYIFLIFISVLLIPSGFAQADFPTRSPDSLETGLLLKTPSLQFNLSKSEAVDFHAIATGIGMVQTNPTAGDYNSFVDVSNAQLIFKKDTGLFQFYLQSGYYSTPSLGSSYQRAAIQTKDSFGVMPLASVSIAPSQNWIFTGGKINSFGGYENTFTYQNNNIDRGLLWNQTSNVSRGFQATYQENAVSTSITLNDGFYSGQLSWMGASLNYQIDDKTNAGLVWTGAIKPNSQNTFITPILQNNSQIFNAIYSYFSGNWSVVPYIQYTYIPANPSLGILTSAQTTGAAILSNYQMLKNESENVTLPVRVEYITSGGKGNINTPNLLYGQGSSAWSATITPTYQHQRFFVRGEISYVQTINSTQGLAFGPTGSTNNQARLMVETGLIY